MTRTPVAETTACVGGATVVLVVGATEVEDALAECLALEAATTGERDRQQTCADGDPRRCRHGAAWMSSPRNTTVRVIV